MNTSSLLLNLPPELCNQLCGYLEPESITNLLKTNHALSYKLKNRGGLNDLALVFPPSSQLKSWPRAYLSTFKDLRSLHFALPGHSKSTYFSLPFLTEDVEALPRNLKHLTLAFELGGRLPLVLAALPPNLLTLSIPSYSKFDGSLIATLPRSLTCLELPKAHLIKDADIGSLPGGLTALNLASAAISGAGLQLLPASLLYLNLEKNELLTGADFDKLPPLLKSLKLIRPLRYATDDQIALLPASLTDITVGLNTVLTDRGISKLPAALKLFNSPWNPNLSQKALGVLPRGLEHLRAGWPELDDSSFTLLPDRLVTLLISSLGITDECFKLLPACLTSLTLCSTTSITDAGLKNIKVPLRHLGVPDSRLTPEAARTMPQSLTTFDFNRTSFNDELEMLHVEYLPCKLTQLHLNNNKHMTEEVFCRLPRQVTSFDAAHLALKTPSTLLGLPPNLTRLRIKGSPNMNPSVWKFMPKTLRFLYFEGASFDRQVVSLLPTDLQELTVTITQHPGTSRPVIPNGPNQVQARNDRNDRNGKKAASSATSKRSGASQGLPQDTVSAHDELSPMEWGAKLPPNLTFVRSSKAIHRKVANVKVVNWTSTST